MQEQIESMNELGFEFRTCCKPEIRMGVKLSCCRPLSGLATSMDGVDFVEVESLTFSFASPAGGNFSTAITARFFRLVIESNYGDRRFIEIDELEFYQ